MYKYQDQRKHFTQKSVTLIYITIAKTFFQRDSWIFPISMAYSYMVLFCLVLVYGVNGESKYSVNIILIAVDVTKNKGNLSTLSEEKKEFVTVSKVFIRAFNTFYITLLKYCRLEMFLRVSKVKPQSRQYNRTSRMYI